MDTKMAQFSTVWETWSPTAGIQEITGSLWLGVSLSGADLGEGSKYRIWQTFLEQNGLQVINCIVAQLTPVFLTGNWAAAKRLFSSPTHPTWSSSFLGGTKFVWLNIIYSQLGDIFFCSPQSDTLSKRNKETRWVFPYNLKAFSSRTLSRSNRWYSAVFR